MSGKTSAKALKASGKVKVLTPKQERRQQFIKAFFSRKPVIVGFIIIVLMIICALAAPILSPYDPYTQDLLNALAGPSSAHPLGTDALGRDMLSRIIYGSRASLSVGLVSTAIAGGAGIALGLLAGYLGKVVDAVVMRIMDAMMSIPVIILALFLGAVLGKGLGSAILTEASLSFLGMGINPPTPSWGAMVSEGYNYLSRNPVIAIAPGIFILITVWSFNVCGDALRDALDPKLRSTR